MESGNKFREMINKCFEDPEFREKLLSDNEEAQMSALEPYFENDLQGQLQALVALNKILDSPARGAIEEFYEATDDIVEFAP
jgi:hypothetical protein